MTLKTYPKSYKEASKILGERLSLKIGNNTYLLRWSGVPSDDITIKLHQTHVVTFKANGAVRLNTGGGRTVTTKDRINKVIRQLGYSVGSERRVWYVYKHPMKRPFLVERLCRFSDGVTISYGRIYSDENR